ncbi:MAG: hypothetical protein PVJ27_09180 [Candidatus Brocadiaceae bacterium]
MSTPVEIAVIGAGSAVFSLGLVRDICLRESLTGSRVALMDMDEERLELMHAFARRYAHELGAQVHFEATLDRGEALQGADFVINTALAGGHSSMEGIRSWFEGKGYYRGMRISGCLQVRLMMSIARDMEELCPGAWLIQAANPLPEGCTAMSRETSIKVCGLCHGHFGYRQIAGTLGLDPDRVTAQSVGLNHLVYMTHFEHEGCDAYPLIDKWIEEEAEEYWRTHEPAFHENQMSRAAIEQYRMLGLMPIGDTPRGGGWWFHTDLDAKKRWYGPVGGFDSEIGWSEYLKALEEKVEGIHAAARDASVRVTELFPPEQSGEQHLPLIDALANDNRVELQVNVPNNGAIEGIPDDVVVEVPAMCSLRGIQPYHVGELPQAVMVHSIGPRIRRMEQMVSFSLRPDWPALLQMILDDHRTRSWDHAVEVAEGLLELPEFGDIAQELERNASSPPPWRR